jgi:hypothetical protein
MPAQADHPVTAGRKRLLGRGALDPGFRGDEPVFFGNPR